MKQTQVIALYLPQFHRIPENDLWWGDGFTEWTNVKKAKPLFENHLQPRIPLNENYYDLSDPSVIPEQMKLAKEYGIDGFCFYHYWFAGKKLLEKPLENLLNEQNIPLNFMFCWANEPWTRTWDGDMGSKQILINQDYGNEKEWEEHFQYLLPFFKRNEYIKKDGRPVIAIYRAADIKKRKEMLSFWNKLAIQNDFKNGLFIINTHRMDIDKEIPIYGDAIYDFEPFISQHFLPEKQVTNLHKPIDYMDTKKEYPVQDYAKICDRMVQRYVFKGKNHYLGFFVGWDNSPRIGNRVWLTFENNTPDVVEYYFKIQYQRSLDLENDFLFINAWNEWGEGAFLEPDETYKYGYLEAIKKGKML
ncbi:MAG: glycoside hydrolase family 99-like domain-containing protein [Lachnospiraceae bacterium]|nr:glycoside hydrolase family 99-like domain-containing protein [Lachnospiraceae bacterium]